MSAAIDAKRRYRARLRGEDIPLRTKPYTDAEVASLLDAYAANVGRKTPWLEALARQLGRPKANLCRKARELGLTDRSRLRGRKPRQYALRLHRTTAGRRLWVSRPHPRGMLGKRHSAEVCRQMSISRRGKSLPKASEERKAAMSRAMVKRLTERPESINLGKRGKGGRRADLDNRYFRSRYEANYARYLTWAKLPWEYETKTFWFEKIKRGTRSYTPDFWIPSEDAFHEVKGWMDPKSETKLRRMKKYHPSVKIIVIGADWFKAAEKQGLCSLIPNWECKHTEP